MLWTLGLMRCAVLVLLVAHVCRARLLQNQSLLHLFPRQCPHLRQRLRLWPCLHRRCPPQSPPLPPPSQAPLPLRVWHAFTLAHSIWLLFAVLIITLSRARTLCVLQRRAFQA